MKVIGDVHGHYETYLDLIQGADSSVQVGDFGFDYSCMTHVDPNSHKIIGGNHDNYDIIGDCPNYLGDYGVCKLGFMEFFFVRGERSIDANLRIEGKNWWRKEELDISAAYKAIEAYEAAKPEIVISHGCPADILPFFTSSSKYPLYSPSRTAQFLDSMLTIHRPKLWIFGHHHNSKTMTIKGCVFQCLNELEIIELP
jgi:predicted phosphodiesterase